MLITILIATIFYLAYGVSVMYNLKAYGGEWELKNVLRCSVMTIGWLPIIIVIWLILNDKNWK